MKNKQFAQSLIFTVVLAGGLLVFLFLFSADTISAQKKGGYTCPSATPLPVDPTCWNCLDSTFGVGGVVVRENPWNGTNLWNGNWIADMAVQPDGKIVAVGQIRDPQPSGSSIFVARYDPFGNPDTTFGGLGLGYRRIDFYGYYDKGKAIAIQSDGKILIAGFTGDGTSYFHYVLRLKSDGTDDPDFGNGGFVFPNGTDYIRDLAVQHIEGQERIVVVGTPNFTVLRLMPNGKLDGSFGGTGIVTASPIVTRKASGTSGASSVAIQRFLTQFGIEERIVVGGRANFTGNGPWTGALMRFNSNGSIDNTFGSSGNGRIAPALYSANDELTAVEISPVFDNAGNWAEDRIVVGGSTATSVGPCTGQDFAVARYLPDGFPDLSFSGDGKLAMDVLNSPNYTSTLGSGGLAVAPDGRITIGGRTIRSNDPNVNQEFTVVRLNGDGTPDWNFAYNPVLGPGAVVVRIPGGHENWLNALTVQKWDGKVIAAGESIDPTGVGRITLVRYNP